MLCCWSSKNTATLGQRNGPKPHWEKGGSRTQSPRTEPDRVGLPDRRQTGRWHGVKQGGVARGKHRQAAMFSVCGSLFLLIVVRSGEITGIADANRRMRVRFAGQLSERSLFYCADSETCAAASAAAGAIRPVSGPSRTPNCANTQVRVRPGLDSVTRTGDQPVILADWRCAGSAADIPVAVQSTRTGASSTCLACPFDISKRRTQVWGGASHTWGPIPHASPECGDCPPTRGVIHRPRVSGKSRVSGIDLARVIPETPGSSRVFGVIHRRDC